MISPRRSLRLPILLAIVMIVMVIALTVGWVLQSVLSALQNDAAAPLYWTLLSVGSTFFALILGGTICYLVLSIKAINLTRRQSNFIASVTHELKSPIASLKLYLQTLDRHVLSDKDREEFQQYMLEDVERLDHLINHLLDAAQLDHPQVEADVDDVELDKLLHNCAEAVCIRYQVPHDTIRFQLQACQIRTSRLDVDMIFRNLIDNAVKYAGSPPRVDISLHIDPRSQTSIIQIRDNGQGIPPALRRKIFGRFVRLGLELERKKPGTGLGLYIVRTLVRRLAGRVSVTGAEPGPGTIFEVQLPLDQLRGRADRSVRANQETDSTKAT